jgi:hypothetical protein
MNVKRIIATTGASLVMTAGFAGAAFAGNAGDGSGYGTQPGFAVSQSNTTCSGHGAFGAFGKDYNFAGGANGQATGANNSSLCGNPQN